MLRTTPDGALGTPAHAAAVCFLRDLIREMARQHPKGETAGRRTALRCVAGAVAGELAPLMTEMAAPRPAALLISPPHKAPTYDGAWPERRFPVRLDATGFRPQSALKMLGYTVGRTNGWSRQDRQEFLQYFVEAHLPRQVIAVFKDEYGPPGSDHRLLRTANLLAANVRNFTRNDPDRYDDAIEDWQEDLAFLWTMYGSARSSVRGRWPRTTVT
ncbi:hypothetical protein E4L95_10570 [Paracoccus liaowanqingii]|uniref:Uncharacterized protein n=1 Tax=Paracoccus liaowanqingii TaxID=2560053 RepID=A0A4Z1BKS5_9RHOB|nr:hypothetical protein E4L95_10570 [Paracoccus liaowanqingii]